MARRRGIFAVVALLAMLAVAAFVMLPFANRDRDMRELCRIGRVYAKQRLIARASEAYDAVRAADRDRPCAVAAKRTLVAWLRVRDASIEDARQRRLAASLTPRSRPDTRATLLLRAQSGYIAALSLDPSSARARRGLRAVLRSQRHANRPGIFDSQCTDAEALRGAGLLYEARFIYASILETPPAPSVLHREDGVQRHARARPAALSQSRSPTSAITTTSGRGSGSRRRGGSTSRSTRR